MTTPKEQINEDLYVLTLLKAMSDMTERLQDKTLRKELNDGALALFNEAKELHKQNEQILFENRQVLQEVSAQRAEAVRLNQNNADDLLKLETKGKELEKKANDFRADVTAKQNNLRDRERLLEANEKKTAKTLADAERSLEKSEGLIAEYEEKLEKLKDIAA